MTVDVVLRGGDVIDGTGSPARRADVAIADGRIVAVGTVEGHGRQEIDAAGCIVTPGFIDPHTHLDAQLCWDATAAPSSLHGVTSVVLGICGFGIAPCAPGGEAYLLRSLEAVEEIPYVSTSAGVDFQWSTWGEYLDHLAGRDLGVNVAGLVPHSALRYAVMGERARGAVASPTERDAMVAELRAALAAGAFGFGTSRGPNHVDAYGEPVVSRHADDAELEALVRACEGRVWQLTPGSLFDPGGVRLAEELRTYADWTRDAGARLSWAALFSHSGLGYWRHILEANRALNAEVVVAPQILPTPVTVTVRFDDADPGALSKVVLLGDVLQSYPSLSHADRRSRLASEELRSGLRNLDSAVVTEAPSRPDLLGATLAGAADAAGISSAELLCDLLLADDLRTELSFAAFNHDLGEVAEMVLDPHTMVGAGDAGAHIRSITSFAYPTNLLATMVRDMAAVPLERAVAQLTAVPARFFGIAGRGTLEAGTAADICVIDLDRLALGPVEIRDDLPGGAQRLFQGASGYRAVLVNGAVSLLDDELTGRRGGEVLRAGD